jgi:hypothetical protein
VTHVFCPKRGAKPVRRGNAGGGGRLGRGLHTRNGSREALGSRFARRKRKGRAGRVEKRTERARVGLGWSEGDSVKRARGSLGKGLAFRVKGV